MLFDSLATRRCAPELMDAPDVDPKMIGRSLRFIRRVNALLGYTRATLSHFKRFSEGWKTGETITVLDVATGSADIPRAIVRWGKRNGFDMQVVGLDRHQLTLGIAHDASQKNHAIQLVRGDALSLPFADGSIDYVITNMFLHHLDDQGIAQAIGEMNRVARRGIVAADLLRHKRAYAWITLLTLLSNSMVRHDARLSVAQAMIEDEVLAIRDRAGVGYASFHRHFGHRFILAGEKG